MNRGRALALVAATPALARCAFGGSRVRVGSKNFTESFVIAEIYAQALEAAGMRVERLFNLGSTQIAIAAMQRGNVDLYPEYTGTALIDVLHLAPIADPREAYAVVSRLFRQRYGIVWLRPSPMNDSQALATTRQVAASKGLADLSDVSRAAPNLRLATIQEFLARPDGLPGLQKFYGGFRFAQVRTYDIALKYSALARGEGRRRQRLHHRRRDRRRIRWWSCATIAIFGRRTTSRRSFAGRRSLARPQIARVLNAVSPAITNGAAQTMNAAVEHLQQDPTDVASAFLASLRGRRP